MIRTVAFIACAVKNVGRSRRFYEQMLGLKLAANPNPDWFEYDLGDTTFVITSSDADHPVPARGALVAFEVSNLDAEVERLRKLVVSFKGEIEESPTCRYTTAGARTSPTHPKENHTQWRGVDPRFFLPP